MAVLSPNHKLLIFRLVPFAVLFLLFGLVALTVEIAAVGWGRTGLATGVVLSPDIILFSLLAITAFGPLVGYLELHVFDELFVSYSFGQRIFAKLSTYLLLVHFTQLVYFPITVSLELGYPLFDPRVWSKVAAYFTSWTHLSTVVQLSVVIGIAVFFAQIGQHMGHATLLSYLSGKYHSPKEEMRIFLFADMTASTSLAEQLGHQRYFDLLRNYFEGRCCMKNYVELALLSLQN